MVKRVIEPGQRYRDVSRGVFGRPANSEWIVEAVEADGLGIPHARLAKVANPSVRKTLAAGVLADPSRFEAV
jgi:hypothetical protein